MTRAGAAAAIFTALLAAGCGKKPEEPKVKAFEDAQKLGEDINKKAESRDPDAPK